MTLDEPWRLAGQRSALFDADAAAYDRYRPRYPDAMFEYLEKAAGLVPGSVIVEVGSGTGIATEGLAGQGYRIVCIEPGARLAEIARAKFVNDPGVEVVVSRFEEWHDATVIADLVLAATSWHWIDPTQGYANAAAHLRPAGTLALVWTALVGYYPAAFGERLDELWAAVLGADQVPTKDPGQAVWVDAIERSGWFGSVDRHMVQFERELDGPTLAAVQGTYGPVLSASPDARQELAQRTTELVEANGGKVTKLEEAILFTATRQVRPNDTSGE